MARTRYVWDVLNDNCLSENDGRAWLDASVDSSNWMLSCMIKKCRVKPLWSVWGKPYGYDCAPCKKWALVHDDPEAVVCNEKTKRCVERWQCP